MPGLTHFDRIGRAGWLDRSLTPDAIWEGIQKIHAFALGIAAAKQTFSPSG